MTVKCRYVCVNPNGSPILVNQLLFTLPVVCSELCYTCGNTFVFSKMLIVTILTSNQLPFE